MVCGGATRLPVTATKDDSGPSVAWEPERAWHNVIKSSRYSCEECDAFMIVWTPHHRCRRRHRHLCRW